jgi:hypothetical protein
MRSFFLSFAILALLLSVWCVFPEDGVELNNHITLSFPSPADIFNTRKTSVDHFVFTARKGEFSNHPSRHGKATRSTLPAFRCTREDILSLPQEYIEFPREEKNLFAPMWRKFEAYRQRNGRPLRILHYGDSQIEADRMSAQLRRKLQERYGGGGIGYISLNPDIPINPTANISLSNGWTHSQALVKEQRRSIIAGPTLAASTAQGNVWIKISPRFIRGMPPLRYTQVRLLVQNTGAPAMMEIAASTRNLYRTMILPQPNVQEITANVGDIREPITIALNTKSPLTLLGIALDASGGTAVDNIPLRSSMGVDFVKADPVVFKQCIEKLDAALIIFQFGVNIVPHQATNYKYYENQLLQQLRRLQQTAPNVPILVVGASDIAHRSASGVVESYPNIEAVRNAQRNAALKAGCAFWDMFQAMGGRNSIISWAYAEPPLATRDFCHFSNNGIDLISELLWQSIAATKP